MADLPNPKKVVDLVVYTPEGRKVVGQCELNDDHISATVTDPEVAKKLLGDDLKHLSIGEDPVRHNVFDPEKKD